MLYNCCWGHFLHATFTDAPVDTGIEPDEKQIMKSVSTDFGIAGRLAVVASHVHAVHPSPASPAGQSSSGTTSISRETIAHRQHVADVILRKARELSPNTAAFDQRIKKAFGELIKASGTVFSPDETTMDVISAYHPWLLKFLLPNPKSIAERLACLRTKNKKLNSITRIDRRALVQLISIVHLVGRFSVPFYSNVQSVMGKFSTINLTGAEQEFGQDMNQIPFPDGLAFTKTWHEWWPDHQIYHLLEAVAISPDDPIDHEKLKNYECSSGILTFVPIKQPDDLTRIALIPNIKITNLMPPDLMLTMLEALVFFGMPVDLDYIQKVYHDWDWEKSKADEF